MKYIITIPNVIRSKPPIAIFLYLPVLLMSWPDSAEVASIATSAAYRYAIRAGADVLPATGFVGAVAGPAAPLQVTGVAADPETVTPNGDGAADLATITYTLSDAATVTATVPTPSVLPASVGVRRGRGSPERGAQGAMLPHLRPGEGCEE